MSILIHVITWITRVETIKRQTRAAYGCLVAGQSLWARPLPTAIISFSSALSVTQQHRCSRRMRLVML